MVIIGLGSGEPNRGAGGGPIGEQGGGTIGSRGRYHKGTGGGTTGEQREVPYGAGCHISLFNSLAASRSMFRPCGHMLLPHDHMTCCS